MSPGQYDGDGIKPKLVLNLVAGKQMRSQLQSFLLLQLMLQLNFALNECIRLAK